MKFGADDDCGIACMEYPAVTDPYDESSVHVDEVSAIHSHRRSQGEAPTTERWYVGGHKAENKVADHMHAIWSEYDGGHSNAPPIGIHDALCEIASDVGQPRHKRARVSS